jgi:ADP-ribose pyrophosphatase YjhB (NUDIX family)
MNSEERDFLDQYDAAQYERPSVTVDLVLMSVLKSELHVLLLRREQMPAKGKWALPGGFVAIDESLDDAARRILKDKARVGSAYLEQLYTFGELKRDPRTRIITVAYFALLPASRFEGALKASPDLSLAKLMVRWEGETGGAVEACSDDGKKLALAFDHAEILGLAVKRLRGKLDYSEVGFELLPPRFTLRQLQEIHEAILSVRFNKPAFRRRILDKKILEPTGLYEDGVTFRPAELYRFVRAKLRRP